MIYYFIALLIVLFDQILKYWIHNQFALGEKMEIIPSFLSLTHVQNTGAAWSILEGHMWFFYIVTLLVVGVVIYSMQKPRNHPLMQTALAFILGGAIGNFIDRLLHRYVIDMFMVEFIDFPVFNIADMALTIGVVLMFIFILFFDPESKK